MTYGKFLKLLAKTRKDYKWLIAHDTLHLRGYHESVAFDCPITAVARQVAGEAFLYSDWVSAANKIKLPIAVAQKIVDAADFRVGHDNHIRLDLFKAIGLWNNKPR